MGHKRLFIALINRRRCVANLFLQRIGGLSGEAHAKCKRVLRAASIRADRTGETVGPGSRVLEDFGDGRAGRFDGARAAIAAGWPFQNDAKEGDILDQVGQ